jgi:hypothetical protein
MAENHILLETIELSQAASSVIFNNIPQTGYTDLKVVMSARNSGNDVDNIITLNSTNKTSGIRLYGTGTGVASDTAVGGGLATPSSATANTFSSTEIYLPNYLGTSQKTVSIDAVNESNDTGAYSNLSTQLFNLTSAVTSITLTPNSGSYVAGSTFSLYAIASFGTTPVTAPFASGGNIVANDGTYWYHAFLSSGTFTPFKDLTCDYLVVAGGGGGGGTGDNSGGGFAGGGGGGAGGLRSTVTATGGGGSLESALSVASGTPLTVTIGAGGAGGVLISSNSGNGSNSVFSTITSTGGGGVNGGSGKTGGSGGGHYDNNNAGFTKGLGTANQGFDGGGVGIGGDGGTGGGGAGAVGLGTGGNSNTGFAGGAGVAISTFAAATNTGVSNYYAGGGGGGGAGGNNGGAGGAGGGAAGGTSGADPVAATTNTGGGGGGATQRSVTTGNTGSNGGSGIVIVRYTMV